MVAMGHPAAWAETLTDAPRELAPVAAAPATEAVRLSLRDALVLALRKNLDLRIARIAPEVLEDDVQQALATFDPVVVTELASGKSRAQPASRLEGTTISESDVFSGALAYQRRLTTGSLLQTAVEDSQAGTNSQFSDFGSVNTGSAGISFTQPLLKGRGRRVNLAPIRLARNRLDMGYHDFRRTAEAVAALTEAAYWNVVYARENLKIRKLTLHQAEQLRELIREKVQVQVLTRNDLTQAEAGVASREGSVILAEQTLSDVEDQLKGLTSLIDSADARDAEIVPVTEAPVSTAPVDVVRSLRHAFEHRPEYLSAKLDLENRQILLVTATDSRYPQLDLSAALSLNGVTGNFANTTDSVLSRDYYEFNVGLSLELPVGLRSARSLVKRRQAEKAQALLSFKKLEQDILLQARAAVRRVVSARKRIRTTEVARKLQKDKLESEQERLRIGRSTAQEVLDFQVDLSLAETSHLKAILDYRKALVDLELAQGTLLSSRAFAAEANVIVVEPPDP